MDSEKYEFTNLDNASKIVETSDVTKEFDNNAENECQNIIDENETDSTTTTNLNSLCDINFPKVSEVADCSGYKDCDMIDSKTFSPVKQETVHKREIKGEAKDDVDIKTDPTGTTHTLPEVAMKPANNEINDCTSPDIKKIKNTVQSPNISIQEVVDKVNKLDIVENQDKKSNISAVILKNQTSSLRNLLMYHSESSDNEDEDFEANWQLFPRNTSSSDSESDSQDCLEISEDDDNSEFVLPNNQNSHKKVNKELFEAMDPPVDISNLQIDYANEHFLHIGQISNFINSTVTIDALAHSDSYNLETVLFIDDKTTKRPLGAITDVIGPVHQPVYCVQLHDAKEIETLGLKEGMKVYSAPKSTYTKYVFLKDLLRMKGTDASWLEDEEPPSDEIDSSDDEYDTDEHRSRKRAHNNSLERHKRFENAKNRCNIIKNKVANMFDKYRPKPRAQNIHMFPHGFNPNIPPPNMPQSTHNNVSVAPFPAPRQSAFNHPRPTRKFPQFRPGPNSYFTNNFGYHHNAAGPSHQNHN